MTIAWESGNADPTTTTSDTSMAVTAPSGIAVGDLLFSPAGCIDLRTIAGFSGATKIGEDTNGSLRVTLYAKIAEAADASAGDFTLTASGTFNAAIAAVHRVSGATATLASILMAFDTGANSQTQTCPTLNDVPAGSLMFWGCYGANNTTSTADKGTERTDVGDSTSGCWMSLYSNVEAVGGTVTGATITTGAFGAKRVFSVAIPPATAAGGGGRPLVDGGLINGGLINGGLVA